MCKLRHEVSAGAITQTQVSFIILIEDFNTPSHRIDTICIHKVQLEIGCYKEFPFLCLCPFAKEQPHFPCAKGNVNNCILSMKCPTVFDELGCL